LEQRSIEAEETPNALDPFLTGTVSADAAEKNPTGGGNDPLVSKKFVELICFLLYEMIRTCFFFGCLLKIIN